MVCFLADKLVIIGAGHEQLHAYKIASKIGLKISRSKFPLKIDHRHYLPGIIRRFLKSALQSIKGVMTLANDVPVVAYIASKLVFLV